MSESGSILHLSLFFYIFFVHCLNYVFFHVYWINSCVLLLNMFWDWFSYSSFLLSLILEMMPNRSFDNQKIISFCKFLQTESLLLLFYYYWMFNSWCLHLILKSRRKEIKMPKLQCSSFSYKQTITKKLFKINKMQKNAQETDRYISCSTMNSGHRTVHKR